MSTALDAEKMDISYNAVTDAIEIKVTSRKTFQDITLIKFLDKTKERNICDPINGFSYNGKLNAAKSTDKQKVYDLHYRGTEVNDGYSKLTAVFTLMDDQGTMNFNLTTSEDY